MKFGSLFSGIGGLDLGLERAGFKCLWQSEINPYASRVLKKHWPDIPNLGDINDINWRTVPTVDLVCGGYPCQPFSIAGHRNGINDQRHLWPEFARCLRTLRPRFALLENVTGHLSLGFGDVQADLAEIGYNTTWHCVQAAEVGAPHKRDRLFVIAEMANTNGNILGINRAKADTSTQSRQRRHHAGRKTCNECRQWWQTEPRMDRVVDGISDRLDRLKGLGNAVVPQVAEHIGNIIMDMAT